MLDKGYRALVIGFDWMLLHQATSLPGGDASVRDSAPNNGMQRTALRAAADAAR